jgi:hypothetical protein
VDGLLDEGGRSILFDCLPVYILIGSMSFKSLIALGPKCILWYMSLGIPHERKELHVKL